MKIEPSPIDIKDAFVRSGLWRRGWSYDEAMARPLLRQALTIQARAHLRIIEDASASIARIQTQLALETADA